MLDGSAGEDFEGLGGAFEQAGLGEGVGVDGCAGGEAAGEVDDVDGLVLDAAAVFEAAALGEGAHHGHCAALEDGVVIAPGAGALAFEAASGVGAFAGGVAASDALARFARARVGAQVVQAQRHG